MKIQGIPKKDSVIKSQANYSQAGKVIACSRAVFASTCIGFSNDENVARGGLLAVLVSSLVCRAEVESLK